MDFPWCQHRPIFPGRFQPSIVGTDELNFRVRNGNGWTLAVKDTDFCMLLNHLLYDSSHTFFGTLSFALLIFVPLILAFRTISFYPFRFRVGFLIYFPLPCGISNLLGAPSGTRTRDPLIKSQLLYQLS